MKKRLLSVLLVLCVMLLMLPMRVLAAKGTSETDSCGMAAVLTEGIAQALTPGLDSPASGTCGENASWSLDMVTGVLTISGTGEMADYYYHDYYERSAAPWFSVGMNIRSIIIQEGITRIGDGAFLGCTGVVKAVLPNSIKDIGKLAFYSCSNLADITIPDTVVTIGSNAFAYCRNLAGEIILSNTTDIGVNAFQECTGITGVEIHGSIAASAFEGCTSLKTVNIVDSAEIGQLAFCGCTNLTKAAIPYGITTIEQGTFKNCSSLKSIIIPDSVITIRNSAFFECSSLESVVLSENIGFAYNGAAFLRCSRLKNIYIPKGVKYLYSSNFQECDNLSDIYFGGNESEWELVDTKSMSLEGITIHYNSKPKDVPMPSGDDTDGKKYVTFYPSYDIPLKSLEVDWNWDLFNGISSHYNNSLSAVALVLSAAAENSLEAAENELRNLGFPTIDSKNYNSSAIGLFQPGVTFGHKVAAIDGEVQHVFVIVVRGTSNVWDAGTDIASLLDRFNTSAELIQAQFNYFVQKTCGLELDTVKSNSKFLITGHSLGGAVANLVTEDLNRTYHEADLFTYTFASPKTVTVPKKFLSFSSNRNIINIINKDDAVPRLPPVTIPTVLPMARYGQDWEISKSDFSNPDFYEKYTELTSKNFHDVDDLFREHVVQTYMTFVLAGDNGQAVSIPHSAISMAVCRVACPVDVEVYTSNGQLAGKSINGVAENTIPDQVYMDVIDNVKYIYLLDSGDYTLNFTGTDTGTMEYTIQSFDLSSSVVTSEKVFPYVNLVKDKKMSSKVSVLSENDSSIDIEDKIKVSDVKLFAVDENGNAIKEILPDGQEVGIIGDVNGDSRITLSDAQITLRTALCITSLTEEDKRAADVDHDGRITLSDVRIILCTALGIVQE